VHLGNGGRGSFLADLGVSLLTSALAIGLAAATDGDAALLGVAFSLGATVWIEARTSRNARHRRNPAEVGRYR
jgi:hypothetical protein